MNFSTFWTSCFYSLERLFFGLKCRKRNFPFLYCQKIKKQYLEKWLFLDQHNGLTVWKNLHFSTFWTFCFYSLERRLFPLEYRKRHFHGLYCVKKTVGKMAIFPTFYFRQYKTEKCSFGKMSIFFTFWTFCFYSLERRFFSLEYRKRHFPVLCCLK